MTNSERRGTPLPLAQALVICREIIEDCRSHDFVLIRPFSFIHAATIPLTFRLSVYAHLSSGHGDYDLMLLLRDGEENDVWHWNCPKKVQLPNPLAQYRLVLNDAVMEFRHVGRYDLVLLANGEELTRHAIQVREKLKPKPRET